MNNQWKPALRLFFSERAAEIGDVPSLEDLCYISGRDSRLWSQPDMYADLVNSILQQTATGKESTVLEMGCASGFLAKGISQQVSRYLGVDIARPVLRIADRLGLQNAEFKLADGERLPFPDASFDAAFCYDVFTNFPSFNDGEGIIREMLRVIRPGGRTLIGSVPDANHKSEYERRVAEVANELDSRFGTLQSHSHKVAGNGRLLRAVRHYLSRVEPQVVCYYFKATDFIDFGVRLGMQTEIADIHPLSPYFGLRFNIIYSKSNNEAPAVC